MINFIHLVDRKWRFSLRFVVSSLIFGASIFAAYLYFQKALLALLVGGLTGYTLYVFGGVIG